jgi:hypothetical protein
LCIGRAETDFEKSKPMKTTSAQTGAVRCASLVQYPQVIKARPSDRRTRPDELSKTWAAERNRIPICRPRPLAAAAGKPRIEVAILQAIGSEISKTRKPIMIRRFEIMFRCEYRNAFSLSSFDHRDCRCLDGGNDELGFCPDP